MTIGEFFNMTKKMDKLLPAWVQILLILGSILTSAIVTYAKVSEIQQENSKQLYILNQNVDSLSSRVHGMSSMMGKMKVAFNDFQQSQLVVNKGNEGEMALINERIRSLTQLIGENGKAINFQQRSLDTYSHDINSILANLKNGMK